MRNNSQVLGLLFSGFVFFSAQPVAAQTVIIQTGVQPVVVEQKVVAMAIVRDRPIIQMILEENTLPGFDPDSVEYLQILDATNNGFGDEDIVVVFPWQKAYTFFASPRLKENMKTWEVSSGNEVITENREPQYFEQKKAADSTEMAKNWMLASILRGVNNNYSDIPMKIYFERKSDGTIKFNTWGYSRKKEALKWKKPQYMPGQAANNPKVIHISRVDSVTTYIANTTLYDQIYIYQQTRDTVYIAADSTKLTASRMISTKFQPGLVPPPPPSSLELPIDSPGVLPDSTAAGSNRVLQDTTAIDQLKLQKLLDENLPEKKK